jgi:hypothetical protein
LRLSFLSAASFVRSGGYQTIRTRVLHNLRGHRSHIEDAPGARMSKAKKKVFSAVKAVKANARDRVGTPPPERVLPDPKEKRTRQPKHKETFADLINKTGEEA